MALFESLFDILYLSLVIALGIHLTLQNDKTAKMFGIMGVILGIGDSFHLLPRIIAHWSAGGFEGNAVILSYGKAVTSITMTIFYLIYYLFYKKQTGDNSKFKDYTVYILVALRVILTVLPQNEWGTLQGNYTFAIVRNIPFLILGILLVVWSLKKSSVKPFKSLGILISLSFLFYLPVVVGAPFYPVLGAFIMPKTVAYFLIVYTGYKLYMPKFSMKTVLEISFIYLIFGLASGVLFREFTKAYHFTGTTALSKVHTHLLSLGFIAMIALFIIGRLLQAKNPELIQKYKRPLFIWNTGLIISMTVFTLRGFMQVLDSELNSVITASLTGFSGIGHIILSLGMILVTIRSIKSA